MVMNFYQMSIDAVVQHFKTSIEAGISSKDAYQRLDVFGYNEIPHEKPAGVWVLLLRQFLNPLMVILLGAMIASFALGEMKDFIVIAMAAFINIIVSFVQEYKAEHAVFSLRSFETQFCNVRRDEKIFTINSKIVVPGDIVLLTAGDKVPADIRVTKAYDLKLDESILTGESKPVNKNSDVVMGKKIIAEQKNMAFAGTFVLSGKVEGVVVSTGLQSYLGQIAELVTKTEGSTTPLQDQILRLSWILGVLMVSISTVVLGIGFLRGIELHKIVTIAIALAVASVPEGLFVTVTAVLAVGMQRMLRRKALVRHLVAAETLGSVSVICTDKTGTLTEGKMLVTDVVISSGEILKIDYSKSIDSESLKKLITLTVLNNDAQLQEDSHFKGNQTDIAILNLAQYLDIDIGGARKQFKRLAEIPFSSDSKFMITLNKFEQGNKLIVKGAPEKVFEFCKQDSELEKFKGISDDMVNQGLRVIAVAVGDVAQDAMPAVPDALEFCGLIGIKDPLRPQAKKTVKELLGAGIKLVVVTGDHKDTAMSIANEAGLFAEEKNVMTGEQLDRVSDKELSKKIEEISIFARVEPRHKIRIVEAFKTIGKSVAMVGDGVNDAPALKSADIGVVLGSGSDVAYEIADMVLLDNNLSSVDAAVREGRTIFDNIRKILVFLVSHSFSEVVIIAGSILCGLPLPLLATQIFWINLIEHGFTHLGLIMEPSDPEIMKRAPRAKNEPILNYDMKFLIFLIGLITDFGLFAMYIVLLKMNIPIEHIRTILFTALAYDSLLYAFAVKSFKKSIFKTDLFNNMWLVWSVAAGFCVQLCVLYIPALKSLFHVTTIGLFEWGIIICLSLIKVVGIELAKDWMNSKD
jgi:Ca2+-transporting ATPase